MKYFIVVVLLAGCNVLPVQYEGGHWALLENPLAQKCVELSIDDGSFEVGGLVSLMSNVSMKGKGIHYRSYGKMCADESKK